MVVRPEDIDIVPADKGMLTCTVKSIIFMGVHYEITLEDADGMEWTVHTTDAVRRRRNVSAFIWTRTPFMS